MNELLLRYLPRMRRWASGRLPPAARHLLDTEDLVQDTLLKSLRHLSRLEIRDDGALQAYLRQALTNALADAYRRSRPRTQDTTVGSNLPAHEASPLEAAIGGQTLERYESALSRLKEDDRQAVILRVELCYEYDQIARMLGKSSAAAARVAVSRALARLSREMKRDGR